MQPVTKRLALAFPLACYPGQVARDHVGLGGSPSVPVAALLRLWQPGGCLDCDVIAARRCSVKQKAMSMYVSPV